MNDEALIFMIVAQTAVTAITVYFFMKSLRAESRETKQEKKNK